MAFRDESEALRARITGLERALAEARRDREDAPWLRTRVRVLEEENAELRAPMRWRTLVAAGVVGILAVGSGLAVASTPTPALEEHSRRRADRPVLEREEGRAARVSPEPLSVVPRDGWSARGVVVSSE